MSIGLMGASLFRLINTFKKLGYFTPTSVNQLKVFGYLSLGAAFANLMGDICKALQYQPGDILEYVDEETTPVLPINKFVPIT